MPEGRKLSVYVRNEEETDFVVAYSPEDAVDLLRADIEVETTPEEWRLCEKTTLTVRMDDGAETKTLDAWVASNGRGHLACSYA